MGDPNLRNKVKSSGKHPRVDVDDWLNTQFPDMDIQHQTTKARPPAANANQSKVDNVNQGEHSPIPPGFHGVKRGQPRGKKPVNGAKNFVVGQAVTCFIEAVFDDGYLLTVSHDDSDTDLRGIVLRPGCYLPVSADNDIAPDVPMIRRNKVQESNTCSTGSYVPTSADNDIGSKVPMIPKNKARVSKPRDGFRNRMSYSAQANSTPTASPIGTKVPPISSIPKSKPLFPNTNDGISRGKVVPVVLNPANSYQRVRGSTESSSAKDKRVMDVDQISAAPISTGHSQSLKHSVNPPSPQIRTRVVIKSPRLQPLPDAGQAKLKRQDSMPFSNLLHEVMNVGRTTPASGETNSTSAAAEIFSAGRGIQDASYTDQGLLTEPLQQQTMQHGATYQLGGMTELLRAVQENAGMNRNTDGDEYVSGSRSRPRKQ